MAILLKFFGTFLGSLFGFFRQRAEDTANRNQIERTTREAEGAHLEAEQAKEAKKVSDERQTIDNNVRDESTDDLIARLRQPRS